MSTLQNTVMSPQFAIINTLVGILNAGDWDRFIASLPNDFVYEFVVFDGPNLCFTRDRMKEHFDSIPGFKIGKVRE